MSKVRNLAFASLLTVGLGGTSVGMIAGASGALAAPAACTKADIVVVSHNATVTSASVRLAAASPSASCDVSLHAYQTQGATWPTSGTQSEVGFATLHLTKTAQTIAVTGSSCFGQNELVIGNKKFDGVDGALPHFPTGVFGTSATLAMWIGGAACPPAQVLPETLTTTPSQVLGETFVAPTAPTALPFTGQPIAAEIAAGAMLVGIGALFIAAGRRSETDY